MFGLLKSTDQRSSPYLLAHTPSISTEGFSVGLCPASIQSSCSSPGSYLPSPFMSSLSETKRWRFLSCILSPYSFLSPYLTCLPQSHLSRFFFNLDILSLSKNLSDNSVQIIQWFPTNSSSFKWQSQNRLREFIIQPSHFDLDRFLEKFNVISGVKGIRVLKILYYRVQQK